MNLWQKKDMDRKKWGAPCKPETTSPIRLVEDSKVISVTEMALRLMAAGTMDDVQKIHGWYHGSKDDIIKDIAKAHIAPKYMSDSEINEIGKKTEKTINIFEERRNAKAKKEIEEAREAEIQKRVAEEIAKQSKGGNQ